MVTQSSKQQYLGAGLGILSALVLNATSMYITVQISTAVALEKIHRIEADIVEMNKAIHGNGQPGLVQQLSENRAAIGKLNGRVTVLEIITGTRDRGYSDGS